MIKENRTRVHTTISLNDFELITLSKLIADFNLKNNNQGITYIVRDYLKNYSEKNTNSQNNENTQENNINSDNSNIVNTSNNENNTIVDNQNNNNISIDKLNNSIDALNKTITNLVSLINKNSDENIKKGTVN